MILHLIILRGMDRVVVMDQSGGQRGATGRLDVEDIPVSVTACQAVSCQDREEHQVPPHPAWLWAGWRLGQVKYRALRTQVGRGVIG